jgi:hypothetical protein
MGFDWLKLRWIDSQIFLKGRADSGELRDLILEGRKLRRKSFGPIVRWGRDGMKRGAIDRFK